MKRDGFSIIELVFILVILGVLVAVALNRLVTTRVDAQIAATRSDIESVLKAVPARILAENIDISSVPEGFATWGDWIIDVAGLDSSRWKPASYSDGEKHGIVPVFTYSSNNARISLACRFGYGGDSKSTGPIIFIDVGKGVLKFRPELSGVDGTIGIYDDFCLGLSKSYPSGSNRVIPLTSTATKVF